MWRPGRAPLASFLQRPARLAPLLDDPAYVPTYVLRWGRAAAPPTSPANATRVTRYLARHQFCLRFRSPTGLPELYERAAGTPAAP